MAKEKPTSEQSAEEGEGKDKKKFPLWIILLVGAQVLLIGGGLMAWKFIAAGKPSSTEAQLKEKANPANHNAGGGGHGEKAAGHGSAEGGEGSGGEGESGSGSNLIGPIMKLDTFIVNLLNEGQGARYLKIDVSFELEENAVEGEIKVRLPQVRDELLTLLSSKRMSDIETPDGKRILRDDIFTRINKILVTGRVKRVYFTDFVIQ